MIPDKLGGKSMNGEKGNAETKMQMESRREDSSKRHMLLFE